MKVTPQELPDVLVLEPRMFGDERGYFMETYSKRTFPCEYTFVQDNVSFSSRGILRGLHLQHPHDQGKLVMAVTGAIWDVAVDVRVGSPTFGKYVACELSAENRRQFFVPPGFAHGFCVLSATAHVLYKCTDCYHPESEIAVRYDDPDLGIPWPIEKPSLSAKDEAAPLLSAVSKDELPRFRPGDR